MRPVEIELRLTMSKILPLKLICFSICSCRDCPQTRVVLLRGGGEVSISSTCVLACRARYTFLSMCRDRRISGVFSIYINLRPCLRG